MCFSFESNGAGDVAVCANFSSHFVAKFFQKVFDEQSFDDARSDCVGFSLARTQRRGRLHPSSKSDHCVVYCHQSATARVA